MNAQSYDKGRRWPTRRIANSRSLKLRTIVADDAVRGEQFWIIQLERVSGSVTRSETPIDAGTAETRLRALGCDTWTIAKMLGDARDAFDGLSDHCPTRADKSPEDDVLPP